MGRKEAQFATPPFPWGWGVRVHPPENKRSAATERDQPTPPLTNTNRSIMPNPTVFFDMTVGGAAAGRIEMEVSVNPATSSPTPFRLSLIL